MRPLDLAWLLVLEPRGLASGQESALTVLGGGSLAGVHALFRSDSVDTQIRFMVCLCLFFCSNLRSPNLLRVSLCVLQPGLSLRSAICPDFLQISHSSQYSYRPSLCFQNIPTGQRASLTFTCFFLFYSSLCYPSCASVSTTVKTPGLYTHMQHTGIPQFWSCKQSGLLQASTKAPR